MRCILFVAALAVAGPATLAAQEAAAQSPGCCQADCTPARPGMGGQRGMGQGEGGGMDHAMMMRMDSLGARLDSLTKAMNRATGSRKVEAMAAVLTALVADHREMQRHMHERMMQQHQMGGGGMDHGGMGMGKGKPDCPAMKPARDSTAPTPTPQHDH